MSRVSQLERNVLKGNLRVRCILVKYKWIFVLLVLHVLQIPPLPRCYTYRRHLLHWRIPIFQLMGICCRSTYSLKFCVDICYPLCANCYRSKYSLNFKVGICYHNGHLLHTLADTHRTLQRTFVTTIIWIFDFVAHYQTYQWIQVCAPNNKKYSFHFLIIFLLPLYCDFLA